MAAATEKTFAWIDCAIVNVTFIAFITWGAVVDWWIGFLASIFYMILLFTLARFLDSEDTLMIYCDSNPIIIPILTWKTLTASTSRRPATTAV
jgi:hypothetical protein